MYYYVTNLQGDVIALLNSSGAPVVRYTYDAWGNLLSTTGSLASTIGILNPIRYRSYVYDAETGFTTSNPAIMTRLLADSFHPTHMH